MSFWQSGEIETDGRYSEPSNYALSVTIPKEYIAVSNGKLVSKSSNGDLTTWQFKAENRREIILAASQNYKLYTIETCGVQIIGLFDSEINSEFETESAMDAAEFALRYYSNVFGDYPYEQLVIVSGAIPSLGMAASFESSGMFTLQLSRDSNYTLYHEMAHQWFYCLVGNSEISDCWLDEGFATWAGYLCMEAAGEDAETRRKLTALDSAHAATELEEKYINIPLGEADPFKIVFYERGADFIMKLENMIGREEFLKFLRTYCDEFSFKNVTTRVFINYLSDNISVDVSKVIQEYILL